MPTPRDHGRSNHAPPDQSLIPVNRQDFVGGYPSPMPPPLPVGKLPQDLLAAILARAPVSDPRVLLGPGIGLDCAVIDNGEHLTVYKSDPITFATDQIGYYLVQVNANDIATTGARPLWLLVTLLLPDQRATPELAGTIMAQVHAACRDLGVSVIGGHTEITAGLDRPIAIGARPPRCHARRRAQRLRSLWP